MTSDLHPSADDVRNLWDRASRAFDDFVESGKDYYRLEVHGPALLATCGDVRGLDVLDLGCGSGYFSRELARNGARVIGVDLSEGQIELARARERDKPLGIRYCVLDAGPVDQSWPPQSFDLVTACMALHDMPDPGGALRAAHVLLRLQGRMVFSIVHPCTDTSYREWERDANGGLLALKIAGYFETGPRVLKWNMERLTEHWETVHWHRTLQEWTELAASAGFVLRRLIEPTAGAEQIAGNAALLSCKLVPGFLIFELIPGKT